MKIPFPLALKPIFFILILFANYATVFAQTEQDAFYIKQIHEDILLNGQSYLWLDYLSQKIGGRLSGTPQAAAAVEYTRQMLDTLGVDSVWLQACMVPRWDRGEKEIVRLISPSMGSLELNAVALGNTEGTGKNGVSAEVIEVQGLEDLEKLGKDKIEGKIVFYNRPMDPLQINTFAAYGGAVDQRVFGASRAAKYGAVAVVVRSMTLKKDKNPHTGVSVYEEDTPKKIPAFALSTLDADMLSHLLSYEKTKLYLRNTSKMLEPVLSYNVIAEIKGSKYPDEIILVGGHLDSWDIGNGAHDDGAGCVHAMEVIRCFKSLNYQPLRTFRCVLFMNEENGMEGSKAYADWSNSRNEKHVVALESDSGGFTPRGFTVETDKSILVEKMQYLSRFQSLLEPYNLYIESGGSGADISRLKSQMGILIGFKPDSQRYFDYHHANTDSQDVVNERELKLGAAAIASFLYLLDQYGIK